MKKLKHPLHLSIRYLKPLLKVIVSIILIWLIFRSVDMSNVIKNLSKVQINLLATAIIIFFFQIIVLSYRWALVTGVLGRRLELSSAIRITFISQFFNQILPSTVGGDGVRIWLHHKTGSSFRQSVHSVISDRALAIVMLLIFILAGFFMQSEVLGDSLTRWVADYIALGSLACFATFLWIATPLCRKFGKFLLVREIAEMSQVIKKILFNSRKVLPIMFLSGLNHSLSIIGLMVLSNALGQTINWSAFFVLVPLVLLLSMIPLSIGGWGVREGVMVAAFSFVGMPSEGALSLSLAFGLVITLVSLPGGLFWLISNRGDLRRASTSEDALAKISTLSSESRSRNAR